MAGISRVSLKSTSDERRTQVVEAAVSVFARTGYWATPVADVAAGAGISPAYVFRLFGSKQGLFVAAIDICMKRITDTLTAGAARARSAESAAVLDAMGQAYAELIADRDLLMLQVQALAACHEPAIREALSRGNERLVEHVLDLSGAPPDEVQMFFARGQLCHLLTALGVLDGTAADATSADESVWARTLGAGIRHVRVVSRASSGASPEGAVAPEGRP